VTGDGTLIELFHKGREKGEEGSESQESETMEDKGIDFKITRVSALTAYTALETL
jgi:hypothetical protein